MLSEPLTDSGDTDSPRVVAKVPDLVGLPAGEAHDRALDAGVLAVAENASHTGAGRAPIGNQDPASGASVETGSVVRIWISTDTTGPA